MKHKISICLAAMLFAMYASAGAQNSGDEKNTGDRDSHITVEISGEAGVVIDGKRITLSEAKKSHRA